MAIRRIFLSIARAEKTRFFSSEVSALCPPLVAKSADESPLPAHPDLCRLLESRGIPAPAAAAAKIPGVTPAQAARRLEALESIGFHGKELKNLLISASAANAATGVDIESRLGEVSSALADLRVDKAVWATIVTQHKRWLFLVDRDEFHRNLANLCSLVRSFQRFKVDLTKWVVQMRPSDQATIEATTEFLRDQAGSEKAFRKVVQCVPMVLQYDVERNLKPRINAMIDHGFTKQQITKIIYQFPKILTVTPDRLTAVMAYLTEDLGLSSDQACRIITIFPRFSTTKMEVISGKVDYFVSCGMDRSKVRLMLRKNPSMVGFNIERSVKPKMEFLASLDFKGVDLDYLLSTHSGVLTRNCQTMEERVKLLVRHGLTRDECSLLLRKKPSIFNLGVELLSRKLTYYRRVMKQTPSSLCQFSSFLTFSMEAKVVPRTTFRHWLLLNGLAPREFSHPYMIMLSRDTFARRFLRGSEAAKAYAGFVTEQEAAAVAAAIAAAAAAEQTKKSKSKSKAETKVKSQSRSSA